MFYERYECYDSYMKVIYTLYEGYMNVEGTFICLFFPSDEGWLHRAVAIGGQMHIIEELQLFVNPQPIDNMVISQAQVLHMAHTRL